MPNNPDSHPALDRELKRGALDLVILAILSERPRYGYDIVTTIAEQTNGVLEVKDGTLYPVLYRLEARHFVEAYWESPKEPGEKGVPRKYYRVTEAGHAHGVDLIEQWNMFAQAIAHLLTTSRLGQ
jgi:PadR family transcriptional regulator PadR